MAEAILNAKGKGLFEAHSAGSRPAARVNPLAVEALRRVGIDWSGHAPRSVEGLEREHWDFVITVCDNAREACPIFPGQPVMAHWGMEDPAETAGTEAEKRRAFEEARQLITRRIELMLMLPLEKLERLAREAQLRAIGAKE
jgi:protein-tyrosine-phosphatase